MHYLAPFVNGLCIIFFAFDLKYKKLVGNDCEYIGFVDSDDEICPEMYETLISAAVESGSDIVCAAVSACVQMLEICIAEAVGEQKDCFNIKGEVPSKLYKDGTLYIYF